MGKQYLNGVPYGSSEIIKFSPNIHTLEEREIGIWTNHKPLYEKVWMFSTPPSIQSNEWTITDIDSTNIESIIEVSAFHTDGTCYKFIAADPTRGNHTKVGLWNSRNIVVNVYILLLQYTKISDLPYSGHYTTDGTEAHHYSINEKVVGTWVDGKPLYEKTIVDNTTHPSTGSIIIDIGVSNIEEFVDIRGMASYGTNNIWLPIIFADDAGTSISNNVIKTVGCNISDEKVTLYIGSNYQSSTTQINKIRITIQYTKITD